MKKSPRRPDSGSLDLESPRLWVIQTLWCPNSENLEATSTLSSSEKDCFQSLTKYNLSSSESRAKSKFKDKRNKTDNYICIIGFEMSFQTTLIISGNIPTSWFDSFSKALNALTFLQCLSNYFLYKELKTWRTKQDSKILTCALTLALKNFLLSSYLRNSKS